MGRIADYNTRLTTSNKVVAAQAKNKKTAEKIFKHFLENSKSNSFEISSNDLKNFTKMQNMNYLFSSFLPQFGWKYEDSITRMDNGRLSTFCRFAKM